MSLVQKSEAYLGPCLTSTMELFSKIVNSQMPSVTYSEIVIKKAETTLLTSKQS